MVPCVAFIEFLPDSGVFSFETAKSLFKRELLRFEYRKEVIPCVSIKAERGVNKVFINKMSR